MEVLGKTTASMFRVEKDIEKRASTFLRRNMSDISKFCEHLAVSSYEPQEQKLLHNRAISTKSEHKRGC
jgi:hypothetical protein